MQSIHTRGLRRFIGDRAFYRTTASIVVPIIIQNTVSNVVSLLDNVMVGQVGTLEMSAVAIINQLMFVFNLCIFGGLAGPGIFSTQYVGAGDTEGVRACFRLKLWLGLIMGAAAIGIFTLMPGQLISIYLTESGDDATRVMSSARDYLAVMVAGLIPFGLTTSYAMTLRENGETRLPMVASVTAICVNLVGNWLLIFGNLGCPVMGVTGAAVATVVSRFVELAIIVIASHRRSDRFLFVKGLYRTMRVPAQLLKKVAIKGGPLLVNEFLWSSGLAAILACYSLRGITPIAASNIASTVNNLFNVVFLSMGNAVSIMVGQALGARENEKAKDLAWKLMATTFLSAVVMGLLMLLIAPLIPQIYNTTEEVRSMATDLLRILAVFMPVFSIGHVCYFTLRAGGRTMITFFFDCVFTWAGNYLCAYILVHFTALDVVTVYACVQCMDILKDIIGVVLVKKGIWIRNIVA